MIIAERTRLIEISNPVLESGGRRGLPATVFENTLMFHALEQYVKADGLEETDDKRQEMQLVAQRLDGSFALATILDQRPLARAAEEQAMLTYTDRVRPLIAEGETVEIIFN